MTTPEWGGPIVAGIDGSPGSRSTVAAAAAQARARGAELLIVSAWEPPRHPTYAGAVPDPNAGGVEAQQRVDVLLAETAEDLNGVLVRCEVREGHAEQILRAAAAEASMLVIGAHGRGGGGGLPLGTVARTCAGYGLCPVLIVPTHPRTG